MNRKIPTTFGPIELISVGKFVHLIRLREVIQRGEYFYFNTNVGNSVARTHEDGSDIEEESTYARTGIRFLSGSLEEVFKTHLVSQATYKHIFKRDLQDIIETSVVDSIEQFGNPTHLVRIFPRTWLLCNPEDFQIVFVSGRYFGLACYFRSRTLVYSIDHALESEVIDSFTKQFPDSKLDSDQILKGVRAG